MNKIKKLAASLAAFTTVATMGIGCISASAMGTSTNTKVYTRAEERFIKSYESQGYSDVAEYLIDNGISLSEGKKMMNLYIDGKRKSGNNSSTSSYVNSSTPFYSTSNLSSNQHYGMAIASNGSANVTYLYYELEYSPSWVSIDPDVDINAPNSNVIINSFALGNSTIFHGTFSNLANSNTPVRVFDFPFDVVMPSTGVVNYSEATLKQQFQLSVSHEIADGSSDTNFYYETFIRGDVNHDGKVDSEDYARLIDYNLGSITEFKSDYSDINQNIAKIVNRTAADADGDGGIGMADIIWVGKHME